MKRQDINIRDPIVLCHEGRYYLYGTRGPSCRSPVKGFDVYVGTDLENWEEPCEIFRAPEEFWADRDFWAPEVHRYGGRFFLFASFKAESRSRGTQVLVSGSPAGPFLPHSDGPVTPPDWECLDGTLYVDGQSRPHIVFCHEWLQVKDGEICAQELSADLRRAVGEPRLLFRGSEPAWADKDAENYVTDGPCLNRMENGELIMIWSSFVGGQYVEAVSRSDNGELDGLWRHDEALLFDTDGGHGMIFRDLSGRLMLTLHRPNSESYERPSFFGLEEAGGRLTVKA